MSVPPHSYFSFCRLPKISHAIILLLPLLFLGAASSADAEVKQIYVSWDYPATSTDNPRGFVLFQDGVEICSTADPASRWMVCEISVGNDPLYFTMTAYDALGNESSFSQPFVLQPVSSSAGSGSDPSAGGSSSSNIIIDNGDDSTWSTGYWRTSRGRDSYGTQSVYNKSAGSEYTFEAALNGAYEVSLWWTLSSGRCANVPVDIYDGDNLLGRVFVNQTVAGGTWNFLGVYDFRGSGAVSIVSPGGCSASADAVEFQMTSSASPGNESTITQPAEMPSADNIEIIIDNGEASTWSTGSWSPSIGPNSYGSRSVFTKGRDSEYTFETALDGVYDVSLWWTVTDSRCANVPIEVYDGRTLVDRVYVDQNLDGGRWNYLGVYDFHGSGTVSIVSPGGCSSSADAVRFQP
jgi:hypothetical protein